MEERNIYQDIAQRTGGDIYIGVVGPVRTGKSTFIKRFMDTLVIPNIGSAYQKDRAVDEMPQSAAGRTIMTTEPKFVPEEAVEAVSYTHLDVYKRQRITRELFLKMRSGPWCATVWAVPTAATSPVKRR